MKESPSKFDKFSRACATLEVNKNVMLLTLLFTVLVAGRGDPRGSNSRGFGPHIWMRGAPHRNAFLGNYQRGLAGNALPGGPLTLVS